MGCAALVTAGLLALDEVAAAAAPAAARGAVRQDGISVYYELHGPGIRAGTVPLVLLHGGALTIEAAFSPELISRFARHQPVIAIEQQGHGHTADRPQAPITIDQMVKDTAGVLGHLKVRQADFLGHSLGGIIAVGMAIRHPGVVRNVTALGAPYRLDGFRADLVQLQRDPDFKPTPDLERLLPSEAEFSKWRASFQRSAPDPKAYDAILQRLNDMLTNWEGWTSDEMRGIRARVLVAIGDDDYVRVDHAAEMAHLIPNGRLAVLPGTTHLNAVGRYEWLEPMMKALAQPRV